MQSYEAPMIYGDLQAEETLVDVFHALDRLSSLVESSFSKVSARVSQERDRLQEVNSRVQTCHGKVQLVRGSPRATTIFSTAKFPAPKKLPDLPSIFAPLGDALPPYRDPVDDVHYRLAEADTSCVGNKSRTKEQMHLYSLCNSHGTDKLRVEFIMEDAGLGPLPVTISSVGALLLFNSDINPYKNYQTLDNLSSTGRALDNTNEAEAKTLASAPQTLVSGDALPDIAALDLSFKPQMGEMASLALPSNLPLDFVAGSQYLFCMRFLLLYLLLFISTLYSFLIFYRSFIFWCGASIHSSVSAASS